MSRVKGNIILAEDGRIGFYLQEGTFSQGQKKLQQVLKALEAEGIVLEDLGEIERHAPDRPGMLESTHEVHHQYLHMTGQDHHHHD